MTEIFLGGQCKQYLSRSFAVANVFIFALPATQPPEEIMMILLLLILGTGTGWAASVVLD